MSLTTEIKALLSTIPNVYMGSLPPLPDNAACIYNSGGFPEGLTASRLKQPTFQIRVRNASYAAGEAMCDTINELLHGYSGPNIMLIQNMGGINDIGRDETGRPEFTMNYKTYFR